MLVGLRGHALSATEAGVGAKQDHRLLGEKKGRVLWL